MDQSQDLKTGTTTVGIVAKDAVILAADMRASMGHLAYDEESVKLYRITENIALTNAGSVGDSLTIIRFLRSQAYLYEIERETRMSAKAVSSYLSNILNSHRYYPYIVQFLIAGFNDTADIYEVTPYGGVLKRDKYAVTGSGSELALATIDGGYKKDMSEEEAIKLAVKAVSAAKKRDLYTGGVSISVMIVRKNGIEELKRNEVEKYIESKATSK
ncbi:MAG: proteasome subunit beta [Candidatus Diapherotrites archaeon]